MDYIDDFSGCEDTYATLCIYSGEQQPETVSDFLGIEPTHMSCKSNEKPKKVNGWFLTSKGKLASKDSRRHIDWVLDQIQGVEKEISLLQSQQLKMYIFCMWASKNGNGGPTISPKQMKRLVRQGLEVTWDVYC